MNSFCIFSLTVHETFLHSGVRPDKGSVLWKYAAISAQQILIMNVHHLLLCKSLGLSLQMTSLAEQETFSILFTIWLLFCVQQRGQAEEVCKTWPMMVHFNREKDDVQLVHITEYILQGLE